jgi:hypothetical protein
MGLETLYTISIIINLGLVTMLLRREAENSADKELKALDLNSFTILGMLIVSMLYTDQNLNFLILLGIVCLPTAAYSYYRAYTLNKKRVLFSVLTVITIFAIILFAA